MKSGFELTRVLITVMTYPHPSQKYQECVCTAGITDAKEWVIGCGKILYFPETGAGGKAKCTHCGTMLQLPAAEQKPIVKVAFMPELPPVKNPRLGECMACSGLISVAARVCPHCGEPKSKATAKTYGDLFFFSVIMTGVGIISLFVGFGCVFGSDNSETAKIGGIVLIVNGIWSMMLASVLNALRDMARNSWS